MKAKLPDKFWVEDFSIIILSLWLLPSSVQDNSLGVVNFSRGGGGVTGLSVSSSGLLKKSGFCQLMPMYQHVLHLAVVRSMEVDKRSLRQQLTRFYRPHTLVPQQTFQTCASK